MSKKQLSALLRSYAIVISLIAIVMVLKVLVKHGIISSIIVDIVYPVSAVIIIDNLLSIIFLLLHRLGYQKKTSRFSFPFEKKSRAKVTQILEDPAKSPKEKHEELWKEKAYLESTDFLSVMTSREWVDELSDLINQHESEHNLTYLDLITEKVWIERTVKDTNENIFVLCKFKINTCDWYILNLKKASNDKDSDATPRICIVRSADTHIEAVLEDWQTPYADVAEVVDNLLIKAVIYIPKKYKEIVLENCMTNAIISEIKGIDDLEEMI